MYQTILNIDSGAIPFVIGGGNDQSYANASGLLQCVDGKNCTVVNIDAHLDVRPRKLGTKLSVCMCVTVSFIKNDTV